MKWLRRTDDARRMKGDPPPTVEQLLVQTKQQGDIIRSLRHQCDGLIAENAQLRGSIPTDSDVISGQRDHRFPRPPLPPGPVELWICPVEGHTKVDWSGNVATCMTCGKQSTDDPKPTLREERILPLTYGSTDILAVDEPFKRRYIPTWPEYTYEVTYGPAPEAGKDETEDHPTDAYHRATCALCRAASDVPQPDVYDPNNPCKGLR